MPSPSPAYPPEYDAPDEETETDKLRRAAETLRELGGEDNYDLADACEEAARRLEED